MAVITFPTALESYVAQQAIGQRRFDTFDTSDVTGAVDVVVGGPARWTMQLAAHDAMELPIAGQWDALMLQLRGGVNHLAMHDLLRPLPSGTARGSSITTSSTTALGASTVAVAGALSGPNLINGGGMELDVADLAVGWTLYSAGATGVVGVSDFSGLASPRAQSVFCDSLGSSIADNIGVFRLGLNITQGQPYTLSADMRGGSVTLVAQINWYTSADVFISANQSTLTGNGSIFQRLAVTASPPPTSAKAALFIYAQSRVGGPASAAVSIDNVQFEAAASASPWAGSPTLRAGDWLQIGTGVGSHLAKVTQDVTLNDLGAGTVTFEPPTRQSYASGTSVRIEKALGHYKRAQSNAGWNHVPGSLMSGGHTLELVEQWT